MKNKLLKHSIWCLILILLTHTQTCSAITKQENKYLDQAINQTCYDNITNPQWSQACTQAIQAKALIEILGELKQQNKRKTK